jgi:cell division protein FtsB
MAKTSERAPDAPPPAGTTRRGRYLLRLVLTFLTVTLFINALAGDKGLLDLMKAWNELATVERSLLRARAENARLREEARRLREDPAAIEELARRDLGMIKPGEKLFIIRDVPPPK